MQSMEMLIESPHLSSAQHGQLSTHNCFIKIDYYAFANVSLARESCATMKYHYFMYSAYYCFPPTLTKHTYEQDY